MAFREHELGSLVVALPSQPFAHPVQSILNGNLALKCGLVVHVAHLGNAVVLLLEQFDQRPLLVLQ